MRPTSRALGLGIALVASLGLNSAAHAVCDIPLIIGSASNTANVLILLDNSGSMNEVVFHDAYDPNVRYSGRFTSTSSYSIGTDANYTPRSFNSTWPSTPSAYLVNSDSGENGLYSGNYLNWVYFNATATERAAIPTYTKIQAAKAVVNAVFTSVTGVRFAVERFNGDNGGTIIAPFGTSIASMQTTVNGIHADSWTPLAESMVTALNYFSSTGASAPIQASCQKSFIIVVTDGIPTQDVNVPNYIKASDCNGRDPGNCTTLNSGFPNSYNCSDYLDNVACYMYRNDLRADLDGIQNVSTFTIGFNIDAPLLRDAAEEGGGEYYTTRNVAGLVASLAAAFDNISKRVAAGASVSVVSSEDRTNNRLFRARYESQTWRGFVESFNLPFRAGSPPLWEAGQLLADRDPDTRRILTSTSGTNTVDFSSSNAGSLRAPLGAASDTEAVNMINYMRGDSISGMRDRNGWVLGDIVDAAPVAVGKPSGFNALPGYASFRAANAYRPEVLYVGGNDGMLHCFLGSDGTELWGYVPMTQLGRLSHLMSPTYCHEYFVNMTPVAYDVQLGGTWKTILVGGTERGGNGLFALDVTDPSPDRVSVLWDVDVPRLKGSWNTPTLVHDRNSGSYRLAVGTGYDPNTTSDSLLVLDPANGSVLSRLALGTAVAGNKTSRGTVVDTDFDGWDDLLYVGDLAGRLFRVNLRTNPWTVTLLFNCGKPIQAAPVVTIDALSRPMVFFGTGQFITATDPTTVATQSIYCVVDDGLGATYTPSNLADQTTSINSITSSLHGWYVNLVQASGERVNRTAALINGTLHVPSFKPSSATCTGDGQAWLYTLDYKDGSAPDNANGVANNVTAGRVQSMGDGVLADPTVDLANEAILLQSSNAVVISQSISGGLRKLLVRGWHQRWN